MWDHTVKLLFETSGFPFSLLNITHGWSKHFTSRYDPSTPHHPPQNLATHPPLTPDQPLLQILGSWICLIFRMYVTCGKYIQDCLSFCSYCLLIYGSASSKHERRGAYYSITSVRLPFPFPYPRRRTFFACPPRSQTRGSRSRGTPSSGRDPPHWPSFRRH